MGDTQRIVTIFVSSPGDVQAERDRLEAVIARLNGLYGPALALRAVRWEDGYYTADRTFQDQIIDSSATDLVICILWRRIGSPLPPGWRTRPDGTPYESGTVFEFEIARAAASVEGTPDILVYRKTGTATGSPVDPIDDEETWARLRREEEAQVAGLRTFWRRWFRDAEGHFTTAFHPFDSTDAFEAQVEDHLVRWLADKGHLGPARPAWPIAERGSPFRGLEPFDETHATVFFGRERAVERAREALERAVTPFLLVLGPSGAGKSSFARAGLVPRLLRPGTVDGVDLWRRVVTRPEAPEADGGPFAPLARALFDPSTLPELAQGDQATTAQLAGQMVRDPEGSAATIARALDRAGAAKRAAEGYDRPVVSRLVLVLDQLEELFPLPDEARARWLALAAALVASGRVWIVATMRSDFYHRLQGEPALLALKEKGAVIDLPKPAPGDIAQIVRRPAEAAGLAFERDPAGTGLDEILERAVTDTDALPLLQFALQLLFEARQGHVLTIAAYDAIGGLEGAIRGQADAAFDRLPETAKAALPALLRALAREGEGGELATRPVRRDRLRSSPEADTLIEAFLAARLLTAAGDPPVLRLAHEALIRNWPRATEILAAHRDFLRLRARVERDARDWEASGRDHHLLWPAGVGLAGAEAMRAAHGDELDPALVAFVDASAARARREASLRLRRVRAVAAALAVLAVAAAGFGWWGWDRSREAERQRVAAETGRIEAERQRGIAEANRAEAETQRAEADRQRAEAEVQRASAVAQRAVAEESRDLAESSRAEAERHLTLATDAVNGLVQDLSQGLRSLEGVPVASIRRILARAEAVIAGLVDRAGADPRLRRLEAMTQLEIASTFETLGDSGSQRRSAERAFDILLDLSGREPGNPAWTRDLAIIHNHMGDALRAQGDNWGAIANFRRALALREALLARDPGRAFDQRGLSISHNNLGDMLLIQGERAAALEHYRAALAIRQRLVAARPDDAERLRDLSISHDKIGGVLAAQGDSQGAMASYELGREIRERLAARDGGDLQIQRDIAISDDRIADILVDQGRRPEALARYRAGLAVRERLAQRDPGNSVWHFDRSVSHEKIGDVLLTHGDRMGALASYRDSLAIREQMSARDPENARWRRDLTVTLNKIADVYIEQGDRAAALENYRKALVIRQELADRDPANASRQRDLSVSHEKIGNVLTAIGDRSGALAAIRSGNLIRERLVALDPENATWQRDLSVGLEKLGTLLLATGDAEGALDAQRQALEIRARFAAADPSNAVLQRDMSVSHEKIADILLGRGDRAGALAGQRTTLAIRERLLELDPGNVEWKRDVSVTHNKIGDIQLAEGEADAALASYLAGRRIREELVALDAGSKRWQRDLSVSHSRVGDALKAKGDKAGALAAYRASLAVDEALAAHDPDAVESQRDLAISHSKIGDAQLEDGDTVAALASHTHAREIRARLVGLDPANATWQRDLSGSLVRIGEIRLAAGDPAEAVESFLAALAIRDLLAERAPDNTGWQRDLTVVLFKLADASKKAGRIADARRWGERAMQSAATRRDRFPGDPEGERHRRFMEAWLARLPPAGR